MIQDLFLMKKFPVFCQKLRVLLAAGHALPPALDVLHRDESSRLYKKHIQKTIADIQQGHPFLQALQNLLPKHLRLPYGPLPVVPDLTVFLSDIESYYQNRLEGIQNIGKKLIYPLTLSVVTVGLLIFFSVNTLPTYVDFFSQSNMEMPMVLRLAQRFMTGKAMGFRTLLPTLFLLGAGLWGAMRLVKYVCFNWLFSSGQADLLWVLSTLTKHGLSLKKTFEVIQPSGTRKNQTRFTSLKAKFFETGAFATSWQSVYPLSPYHHELLISAEQGGELSHSLTTLANLMRGENVKRQMRIIRLIQPCLLILLGLLIFSMMYLTYLPTLTSIKLLDP